jgi:membrane fusion protein
VVARSRGRAYNRLPDVNASLDNLNSEASLLHNQMTTQVQRIKSGETLVSMASTLAAKGLVSEVDRVHREQAVLDDTERLSSMAQQATTLQDRTSQTRYELDQLATVTATKLQPVRSELSSTEQRIAEIGARRAYAVRAPISGRVSMLQVNVGQPVDPHRLEMEIVSANANLEAVLFVPARAAGFVHAGQRVRLLYDAFPYQKYGTHSGTIIGISQTILTGADVSGPIALKEPAYKAIVALDEAAITTRDKKTIPLLPDMLLRADIILERRTIMSWILEPLLSARM